MLQLFLLLDTVTLKVKNRDQVGENEEGMYLPAYGLCNFACVDRYKVVSSFGQEGTERVVNSKGSNLNVLTCDGLVALTLIAKNRNWVEDAYR